jgi:hypothetical protein
MEEEMKVLIINSQGDKPRTRKNSESNFLSPGKLSGSS